MIVFKDFKKQKHNKQRKRKSLEEECDNVVPKVIKFSFCSMVCRCFCFA